MSKTESKFHEGDLLETYLNIEFVIDEEVWRTWYDLQQKHLESSDCSDVAGECVFQLTKKIARSIKECGSKSGIDILYLWTFACEHVQAMTQAMIRTRLREVLTTKLTEMEKLSFEEKCLLEVMQEVIAGIGDGEAGGVPYTVTKEMVDAKIREKTQKQK
jgi:hypothetical protein